MRSIKIEEIDEQLTDEELQELDAATKKPVIFDEDSPELTDEALAEFKRVNRKQRVKQTVSLRLSAKTINMAKSYGKGYTSFLSRLIELAINDKDMVKRCL